MKRILIGLALTVPAAASADVPPPPAPAPAPTQTLPPRPVQAFGEAHPNCLEWTDGCIVCKRQNDETVACSMVGIACLPAAPACSKTAP